MARPSRAGLAGRPQPPPAPLAPRPRPPRPRQPQQEACGRALVRSFARKSLAPRSAPVPTLSLLPAPRAQRPPRAQVGKPRLLGAARQRRAVSAGLALGGALSSQRPAEGPGPLVVCTLEGLLSRRGWRRRRALSRSRLLAWAGPLCPPVLTLNPSQAKAEARVLSGPPGHRRDRPPVPRPRVPWAPQRAPKVECPAVLSPGPLTAPGSDRGQGPGSGGAAVLSS